MTDRVRIPAGEVSLSYARSGGPGGQHVNRTASKVQLRWNPRTSSVLSDADRAWLLARLSSRLTTEGDLIVASERHREQGRNVEDALLRLATILRTALRRPRPRKATRPTRASKERRLDAKKRRSESKRGRRPPSDG